MELEYFGLSDKGIKLDHNEDYYRIYFPDAQKLIRKKGRLFVVADGMGGHLHGEVASKMAVDVFVDSYYEDSGSIKKAMKNSVIKANETIFASGQRDMGTTLTAAVFAKKKCYVAHVGDSRLYLLRGRGLWLITKDHSWVAESLEMGTITKEQAENHPYKNVLTRSIGKKEEVEPDLYKIRLHNNDRFLLCSDGVHSVLSERSIYEILKHNEAPIVCRQMIELAKEQGSQDNLTCIAIQVIKKGSGVLKWKVERGKW